MCLKMCNLMRCDKFKPYLHTAYVLHDKDVSVKDGVIRLPLYMAQFVIQSQ